MFQFVDAVTRTRSSAEDCSFAEHSFARLSVTVRLLSVRLASLYQRLLLLAAVFHIGPILLLPPRWRPYSPFALFSESGSRTRPIHQSWTETRPVSFVTLVRCGHV